jgi:hypothetical protein
MAILSYAYLKLKIPGPATVITTEAKAQRALDCEKDNIKLATTTVAMAELRELSTTRSRHATHIWRFQSTREDSVKIMQIGASLDHE